MQGLAQERLETIRGQRPVVFSRATKVTMKEGTANSVSLAGQPCLCTTSACRNVLLASSLIFPSLPSEARLCFLRLTVQGWLGQGQDNECFAGHGADVVVEAHHLDASDVLH